jgi:hypothetical protein
MPLRSSEESRKPVERFHDGPVHLSIWENEGVKGAFRTATFQLRYKDKEKDEWHTGTSYGLSDLEHLERANVPPRKPGRAFRTGIPRGRRPPGPRSAA